MLRTEHNSMRFTKGEADEYRAIGIDVADVRSSDDFGAAVKAWLCDFLISRKRVSTTAT